MPAEGRMQGVASLGLAGLAVVAVVAGLALTGGPGQGRKERRDATRDSDLMALAQQVECLAVQGDGRLPAAVAATEACPFTGRLADPFTGAPYRYEVVEARSWRLCADYELAPEPAPLYGAAPRDAQGCSIRHLPPPVELRPVEGVVPAPDGMAGAGQGAAPGTPEGPDQSPAPEPEGAPAPAAIPTPAG